MVKRYILLPFFVILSLLAALFQVKYTVLDLENEHRTLRRAIKEKQEELHVLNAEWAYLNDPERLFALSKKHLQLRPIRGQQIVAYGDLQNSGLGEYDREELAAIVVEKKTPKQEEKKQK
jgi:cell division protein FtsL